MDCAIKHKGAIKSDDFEKKITVVKEQAGQGRGLKRLIGVSKAARQILRHIECTAEYNVSVLLTGESGTGKELVARAIHEEGMRAGKPFVAVNCGAIPEGLFENELFGHQAGAFTNADLSHSGLVQEAEGGTLFLDEVPSMTPYVQVKLLRLLQEREYKPLGAKTLKKANIRIIAATNRDLRPLVKQKAFREDLYYRLNIVSINTPPLRERREDIPGLAQYFLKKYARQYNKTPKTLTDDALRRLISYDWPGNIRELENKIQQSIVLSSSAVIDKEALLLPLVKAPCPTGVREYFKAAKKRAVEAFEKEYLENLMTDMRGDVVAAAKYSGKSRTALWNILKKHNISPKTFRKS